MWEKMAYPYPEIQQPFYQKWPNNNVLGGLSKVISLNTHYVSLSMFSISCYMCAFCAYLHPSSRLCLNPKNNYLPFDLTRPTPTPALEWLLYHKDQKASTIFHDFYHQKKRNRYPSWEDATDQDGNTIYKNHIKSIVQDKNIYLSKLDISNTNIAADYPAGLLTLLLIG